MLGVFLYHDVDRVQQPLQIALLDEWRTKIRHDEVAHKENALIRQFDEHRVRGFSSTHRNKPDARSTDFQLGGLVNGDVRLECAYVIQLKARAEEVFIENAR